MKVSAPFTLEHYRMLLQALLARGDVEFITYNDLAWSPSCSINCCENEFKEWKTRISKGEIDTSRCYILIQHDADSGPQETENMSELEAEYGIVSNIMIFSRWYENNSRSLVPYPIDRQKLKSLEAKGFVIGYHVNAFQNTDFQTHTLQLEFEYGLEDLRRDFDIRYFSPHGGELDSQGRGNASFNYIREQTYGLRWVHNGSSPSFTSTYTDGGFFKRIFETNNDRLDFLRWAESLRAGTRNRLLIHPQYFNDYKFKPLTVNVPSWYTALI
jgi:hypothetical protein